MRTSLAAATSVSLFLSGAALAAGTTVVNRPVTAFKGVEISGGAELTVQKGEHPTLVLSGEEAELAKYRTEVRDGVLHLEPRESQRGRQKPLKIVATTPSLESLKATGGADVTLAPGVAARALRLELGGGVHLQADALGLDALRLTASGGVDAHLAGKATSAVLDVSGGVDLDASSLEAAKVELDASGGCTVKVRATQAIDARASGGVGVSVAGKPTARRVKTSGGADVSFDD
jgi:Putative auto-transporter adhesin, head GIN domain